MSNELPNSGSSARWLTITRAAMLAPLALALGHSLWAAAPIPHGECSEDSSLVSIILWIMAVPGVFSLRHLLGRSVQSLKKGLAWAVVSGLAWGGIALAIVVSEVSGGSWRDAGLPLLTTVIYLALGGAAIIAYYSGSRAAGDFAVLLKRLGLFIGLVVLAALPVIALPDFYAEQRNGRAASAADSLRQIKAAEDSYAQKYSKGFTPSLAALGPPSAGAAPSAAAAGLIPANLARGSGEGYMFKYMPEAPGPDGKITKYSLTARPIESNCTRWKRFFMDESGSIHVNTEGNATTRDDLALSP